MLNLKNSRQKNNGKTWDIIRRAKNNKNERRRITAQKCRKYFLG